MSTFDKKVISNSIWIVAEKAISLFGLVFVNSMVAKYIGSENFGKLNLGISLFAIVQIFAYFGCNDIVFQRASRKVLSAWTLIDKTRYIRDGAFFISAIPILIYLYFFADLLTFYFSLASAVATYIAVHDLYSIYFNAKLQSYINTITNVIGLVVGLSVRFLIALAELDILWLTLPIILLTLIPFLIRWYIFYFIEKKPTFSKFSSVYNRYLFFNGAKLLPYTLSVAIFTRLSQLFLSALVGMSALGIYSVITTLGNGLAVVVSAIMASLSVKIFSEKDDNEANIILTKAAIVVTGLFMLFLVFLYLFKDMVIELLYGTEYKLAADYLPLYAVTILFATYSGLSEKYILRLRGYDYLFKKMMALLIIAIPISYGFILIWGLKGAVLSTILIEFLTTTVLNYFFRKGEIIRLHIFIIKNFFNPNIWRENKIC